jgi:hypothetical protein
MAVLVIAMAQSAAETARPCTNFWKEDRMVVNLGSE